MSRDGNYLAYVDEVAIYNKVTQAIIENDDGKYIRNNLNVEEVLVDVSNFSKSPFTKIRGEIMKRLGQTTKKLGANVNMRSNQTILDSMIKNLPDPDKITIQADDEQMTKISNTVVQVINDIILADKTNPVKTIGQCSKVLLGLSNGISADFNKIMNAFEKIHNAFISLRKEDEDNSCLEDIISDLAYVCDLMKSGEVNIGAEIGKQEAQVEQLQSEEVGPSVTRLISTLTHVGRILNMTDETMREVSSELSKFKKAKNIAKISEQFASESLNAQLYNREAIVGGGWGDHSTGGAFDMTSEFDGGESEGSVDDFTFQGGKRYITGKTPEALEKDAKKKQAADKVKEFVNEMNVEINEFVENVYEASKHLGDTKYDLTKVEDSLENVKHIENLRSPNIYLSLVGYYLDDTHRTMASQYKDKLLKSIRAFKDMAKMIPNAKKPLNAASNNIYKILKIVDHFHDILKTLLAATCLDDIKEIVSDIPQSMGNIGSALNRLYHALHISQMRRNIRKCSTDLNRYSEHYPELLSWAVGNRRRDLDREYSLLTAEFATGPLGVLREGDDEDGAPIIKDNILARGTTDLANCSIVYKWRNAYKDTTGEDEHAPKKRKCLHENVRGFEKFLKEIDDEFRAKHRLYKALESLDLLLSTFTKELVKDVDLMKEVKKYLDDTKVYTKWFTDYTGNLLAGVFESMPAYVSKLKSDTLEADDDYDDYDDERAERLVAQIRLDPKKRSLTALREIIRRKKKKRDNLEKEYRKKMADGDERKIDRLSKEFRYETEVIDEEIKRYDDAADEGIIQYKKKANIVKGGGECDPAVGNCNDFRSAVPKSGDKKWANDYINFKYDCPNGNEFGNPEYNTLSEDLKNPVCMSFYYKQLCQTIAQTNGKPVYGKATGVVCMKGKDRVRRNVNEFYNNFQALKNIFHSFITMYNHIIEKNIKSQPIMTPSQIYYCILSYLKQSALARRRTEGQCHNQCGGLVRTTVKSDETIAGRTTWETKLIGMILPAYYPTEKQLKDYSVDEKDNNMYREEYYKNDDCLEYRKNISANYRSVYEAEDRICAMGIKSIASAVLSCMGLFTVSQQPVNVGMQRTVRSILGGGGKPKVEGGLGLLTSSLHGDLEPIEVPKVHDDTFGSYYYIVRLAEFYKQLFKNLKKEETDCERNRGDPNRQCSIRLPNNLEGEFGKIIYIVNEASDEAYNDNQTRVLVSEINKLYNKYGSNEDLVCAFVKEVNRTFSCLVDEEAQKEFGKFEQRLISDSLTSGICASRYETYDPESCMSRGIDRTGSMPFEDEDEEDADIQYLDRIVTPSDSMGKSISKYLKSSSLDPASLAAAEAKAPQYLSYDNKYGSDKLVMERALSKYKFCGEYKLYHKLALLRTELDKMFDRHLRSTISCDSGIQQTKNYPLTTDKYREDHHHEHIEHVKLRLKSTKGENDTRFKITKDLINTKTNTGDACFKGSVTKDCLFLFGETTALMTDALFNARNLLNETLKDIAIFSGDVFYNEYKNETGMARERVKDMLGLGDSNAHDGKTIAECYDLKDEDIVKALYSKIVNVIINKLGGVKLLGLGCNNQTSKMKNVFRSIWHCKQEMQPHRVAIRTTGVTATDYSKLDQNTRAQLIINTINQVLLRFELSPIHATIIGTVARLSSALGGVVSTTISSQGTYMDVTPLQSILIDCLSEVKQLASRFYDQFPKGFMASYYARSDPDSSGSRSSIYDIEYDLTTVFEPHYSHGIKCQPLIASSNAAMTHVHTGLVGDFNILYDDSAPFNPNLEDAGMRGSQTQLVKDNNGGNAIMSAIMPTHYEPTTLSRGAFSSANQTSTAFEALFNTFVVSPDNKTQTATSFDPTIHMSDVNKKYILTDISSGMHMNALLPALNYGIKSMIASFYDYGSRKIYKGILDSILETKLANNIENLNTSYPDVFNTNSNNPYIHYGIPNRNALLVTSTCMVIRSLFTTFNQRTQTPQFLYESIAEIRNMNLVDVYKLKLPMFREYFLRLVNKCRVIRGFLTKGCGSRENKRRLMTVVRPWARVVSGTVGQHVAYNLNGLSEDHKNTFGIAPDTELTLGSKIALEGLFEGYHRVAGLSGTSQQYLSAVFGGNDGLLNDDTFYADSFSNEERYGYFMEIVSNIEDVSIAIANKCDTILKEFVQDDRFMIPSSDFLEAHSKKFDEPPFTPLSLISIFTSKRDALHKLHELDTMRDTDAFRLQFGARGILYSDNLRFLNEKYINGALCAVKCANQDCTVKIDASAYLSFIKHYLSLFRFNFSVYDYSQLAAVSGNYRDTGFKGGFGKQITLVGAGDHFDRFLDIFETNYDHIPSIMKYQSMRDPVDQGFNLKGLVDGEGQFVGDRDLPDYLRINGSPQQKYTVRKIASKVDGNDYGIWLVDWIVNHVTGDGNFNKKSSYEIKEENIRNLYKKAEDFNPSKDADCEGVICLFIAAYELRDDVSKGKIFIDRYLKDVSVLVIQCLNRELGDCGLLNIDARNIDTVLSVAKKYVKQKDIKCDDARAKIMEVLKLNTNSGGDMQEKMNHIYQWYKNRNKKLRTVVKDLDGSTTLAELCKYAVRVDLGLLSKLIGDIPSIEFRTTEQLDKIMNEHNVPVLDNDSVVYTGIHKDIRFEPKDLSPLTGGALTDGSLYNLMQRDELKKDSNLIYTTSPDITTSLTLEIIAGQDIADLKDIMTENLGDTQQKTKKKDYCGEYGNGTAIKEDERVQNLISVLIELNVNPINVHSLQRFIPFANIYNYSYTLDRFIYTMYDIPKPWDQLVHAGTGNPDECTNPGQQIMCFKNVFDTKDITWRPGAIRGGTQLSVDHVRNPNEIDVNSSYYADIVKETFLRLMMDPYAHIDQFVYGVPAGEYATASGNFGPVVRMMRGFDMLGMGVPKFLSDQVLCKPLLDSMFLGNKYGPTVQSSTYHRYIRPRGMVKKADWEAAREEAEVAKKEVEELRRAVEAAEYAKREAATAKGETEEVRRAKGEAEEELRRAKEELRRAVEAREKAEEELRRAEMMKQGAATSSTRFSVSDLTPSSRPSVSDSISLPPGDAEVKDLFPPPPSDADADSVFSLPRAPSVRTRATDVDLPVTEVRGGFWTGGGGSSARWDYPAFPGGPYNIDRIHADHSRWEPLRQGTVSKSTFGPSFSGMEPHEYMGMEIRQRDGYRDEVQDKLTFYDPETKDVLSYDLTRVFANSDIEIEKFRCEGYERFNTQLIRNVVFITNLQRLMRYTLNLWLTKAYGAVAHNHRAIAGEVTERRYGGELPVASDNEFRATPWI